MSSLAITANPSVRSSHSFPTAAARRRYWYLLGAMAVIAVACGLGVLAWANPMPFGTEGFWLLARRRANSIVVIAVVAVCQAFATVAFQTVTNNRIITPSIMGFEAIYMTLQTSAVYFLGVAGLVALQGVPQYIGQILLMIACSLLLYGWLLSGKFANLQIMLLVGIVIGGGLASVSSFMRRLLSPSEFDVLAARMFGSISNADADYLPIAVPLALAATVGLWLLSYRLNVMGLGREASINLGLNHRFELLRVLFLVSILIAVSTALIGPMIFFGFLVATLTYSLANTFDHRYVFPLAVLTGFVVLCGAYFVMRHVFSAQGVVSIIIELVGGLVFLIVVLKRGRL